MICLKKLINYIDNINELKVIHVGKKYSGIEFLQSQTGHRPSGPR